MKIQCDYCKNTYEDTQPQCLYCGAPNPSHNDGDARPRTIGELKQWYKDRGLPDEKITRFFIGKDYRGKRAFGIYKKDNGEFVVYKNKANGERAIRYLGTDEQYAVNELYLKLKDEIVHQKARLGVTSDIALATKLKDEKKKNIQEKIKIFSCIYLPQLVIWPLIIYFCFIAPIFYSTHNNNGYYTYDGTTYYHHGYDWYVFESYDTSSSSDPSYVMPGTWSKAENSNIPETLKQQLDDYYLGNAWNSEIMSSDFETTEWYQEINDRQLSSDSYDNDNSYNWSDNDSWDSDYTDWNSDW